MCDGEMIDLTEIHRASGTPLEAFTEKLRNTLPIQRRHFCTDVTVVQHT